MKIPGIMKCFLLIIATLLSGCTADDKIEQEVFEDYAASASVRSEVKFNFTTSLKGENEVQVTAVETNAAGHASVKISKDETYLEYKITVANIDDVLASHFHLAPAGSNGGVVAFLFSGPVTNPNGVLAEGIITEEDLIGPLAGSSFQELLNAIRSGNIYVNVHSTAYPGGELRGQL